MRSPNITISRSVKSSLALLFIINTINYVDRMILAILSQSIKEDLGLSDTQLGILTGFAFAAFYALMGLPIARWSDRGVRKNIITLALTFWSAMTALTSLAQVYWHLLIARFCVGIGEAGCIPTSHSMISDYYPQAKRTMALAVFSSGASVGVLLGFSVGGWLGDTYGWRLAFLIVGLPGLVVAALAYFLLIEPERGQSDQIDLPASSSLPDVLKYISKNRTFLTALSGATFGMFMLYGIVQWAPPFFIRVHGMTLTQVGISFGLAYGVGQLVGMLIGGKLGDYLIVRDKRWIVWISGAAYMVSAIIFAAALLAKDANDAFILFGLGSVSFGVAFGPQMSTILSVIPANMRATASSIGMISISLLGIGLAPVAIGFVSDLLSPEYGNDGLRIALVMNSLTGILAAVCFLFSSKTVKTDLEKVGG